MHDRSLAPNTDPPHPPLTCADLHVHRGDAEIVRGVDLTIRAGECVTIIGPNGAGKTTLLLALMGQLPSARGTVRIGERDVHRTDPRARARAMAYVPQGLAALPPLLVNDIVAGARFAHRGALAPLGANDDRLMANALELCNMSHLADRRADQLSAGERQKLMLAAAIAQDASILILDEPNTALDPAVQLDLVRVLRNRRDAGQTIILVSHDLQLPLALESRILAMREGQLLADDTANALLTPDRLHAIYGAQFERLTGRTGKPVITLAWDETPNA